jgi:hypothetical protein
MTLGERLGDCQGEHPDDRSPDDAQQRGDTDRESNRRGQAVPVATRGVDRGVAHQGGVKAQRRKAGGNGHHREGQRVEPVLLGAEQSRKQDGQGEARGPGEEAATKDRTAALGGVKDVPPLHHARPLADGP